MRPKPTLLALLLVTVWTVSCSQDKISIDYKSFLKDEGVSKDQHILEQMNKLNIPGVSIAVYDGGELQWARGFGDANTETGTTVTEKTLFQAGSISKPVAALGILVLAHQGKLDLDTDVNEYLKDDWKVPESDDTADQKVTLRLLLAHAAGITVHGFPGYKPSEPRISTVDVLNGNGNTGEIKTFREPGADFKYSGGGYTIAQKVVEDVTGQSFEEFMKEAVFNPLKMSNSTYEQPLPDNWHETASSAYNKRGKLIKEHWHVYPEKAAAGLWTTPSDLVKYCQEIQNIMSGQKGIVSRELIVDMLTPVVGIRGLGPGVVDQGDSLRFFHGGKNAGFTNHFVAYANKGQALVIMTNGDSGGKLFSPIEESITAHFGW